MGWSSVVAVLRILPASTSSATRVESTLQA